MIHGLGIQQHRVHLRRSFDYRSSLYYRTIAKISCANPLQRILVLTPLQRIPTPDYAPRRDARTTDCIIPSEPIADSSCSSNRNGKPNNVCDRSCDGTDVVDCTLADDHEFGTTKAGCACESLCKYDGLAVKSTCKVKLGCSDRKVTYAYQGEADCKRGTDVQNSCWFSNDSECDEFGPNNVCRVGTDTNDCNRAKNKEFGLAFTGQTCVSECRGAPKKCLVSNGGRERCHTCNGGCAVGNTCRNANNDECNERARGAT